MGSRWSGAVGYLFIALVLGVVLGAPAYGCNCGANCQCGGNCSCGQWTPPPPPGDGLTVRKNQSTLTDQEKQDFIDALKQLKQTYHPGATISIYDEYVDAHMALQFDIHRGPAFFPWHRAFLRNLELELQAVNPNVAIPYWDFTVDNTPDASLWADNFLGGDGDPDDGDAVKTGPFARGKWTLLFDGPDLRRQFGWYAPTLPTADQVQGALDIPTYDSFPFDTGSVLSESFRNYMAGWNWPSGDTEMHNRVHAWVGGSMLEMTSPNDPVFVLVHAYLDLVWVQWQAVYGFDYPEEGAPDGQNLYDVMAPFGVRPADVLDHTALGYVYDVEQGSRPKRRLGAARAVTAGPVPGTPVQANAPVPVSATPLPDLPAWFKALPKADPGQIGLHEWVAAGRSVQEFRRMDLNDDGILTAAEVRQYLASRRK